MIDDKNIFVNHFQRGQKQHNQLPALHVKKLANNASDYHAFSWDTYGILFVIDNSATAIISNKRRLFTGQFKPMSVNPKTTEGLTTTTKLVRTLCLLLTEDSNEHHVYKISQCIYDPKRPLKILGIPYLGTFFRDNTDVHSTFAEDGTAVKSGATKSHFVWNNGKHKRQFIHSSIHLPQLTLYAGHGYCNDFFMRVHKLLREKVHCAFLSAYSIDPATALAMPDNTHVITFKEGDLDGE